jgi:hypothetical protein
MCVTPIDGGRLVVAVAALLVTIDVRAAAAQSLGDIARAEAERRKQATSGRSYTNDDLSAEARAEGQAVPQQPAATAATAAPKPGSAGGVQVQEDSSAGVVNQSGTEARPKRDEQYWRARAKEIRDRQAKLQADLADAEQRLQALDAGPQTPLAARERQLTATALERLRADARLADQAMTQLKTMAAATKIPLEWIQ